MPSMTLLSHMQTKTILIVVLAVLVVIAGAFYWYEYRPSQIRKECYRASYGVIVENNIEKNYETCLLSHGLEK